MNDPDPNRNALLAAMDAVKQQPGLTMEAAELLRWAEESTLGRPLGEIVEEMQALQTLHWDLFQQWMSLCIGNKELLAHYDRLRGTNLSRRGFPMDLLIDQATGRLDDEAVPFLEFCHDVFMRIDPKHLLAA